ncbi:unnamed protein product [Withania somnifera]
MKSLFMFYVVLFLISFYVVHINHALGLDHEGSGAIQEKALIPRPKYTITPTRKLLLLPDIGDGTGDGIGGNGGDGEGIGGNVGGGDGIGGNGVGVGNGINVGGGGDGISDNGGDGIGGNGGGVGSGSGDGGTSDNSGDDGTGGNGGDEGGGGDDNRIGPASCSKDSIQVNQGATQSLPSGIPTYTVIVENTCYSVSCSISNIHLSCGWFSSARLINPRIFRRLSYNDCLINDGEPLSPGQSLMFQYANTFKYPLSVSAVTC